MVRIHIPHEKNEIIMKNNWTPQELAFLREKYPSMINRDLAVLMGRTLPSLKWKSHSLGLKKSDDFFNSAFSGRLNGIQGMETRLQKFHPGWNKGLKQKDYLTPEAYERAKQNRFKAGQDPHNTVPIGTERISKDGYVEVKVRHEKGLVNSINFEFKHRILFENAFGPIPKKMILVMKDGDKMNYALDNLELITKSENMQRNRLCDNAIVKKFLKVKDPEMVEKVKSDFPKIIELKRTNLKLNQQIQKHHAK
jgi:hypothetical protein